MIESGSPDGVDAVQTWSTTMPICSVHSCCRLTAMWHPSHSRAGGSRHGQPREEGVADLPLPGRQVRVCRVWRLHRVSGAAQAGLSCFRSCAGLHAPRRWPARRAGHSIDMLGSPTAECAACLHIWGILCTAHIKQHSPFLPPLPPPPATPRTTSTSSCGWCASAAASSPTSRRPTTWPPMVRLLCLLCLLCVLWCCGVVHAVLEEMPRMVAKVLV